MGSSAVRFSRLFSLGLSVLALVWAAGCQESRRGAGEVSSQEFTSVRAQAGSIRQLTTQLSLLREIFPTLRDDQLEGLQPDTQVLGKVTLVRPDGRERESLLIYEASRAILSVDLCPECSTSTSFGSFVTLHYDARGLDTELEAAVGAIRPALDLSVPPLALKRHPGWIVAVDDASNGGSNIIAFRAVQSFREAGPPGISSNFGRGNGVLLSVVASEAQIRTQLGSSRTISRLFEMEDGRLMLFFRGNVREIHVLELRLDVADVDHDLDDPAGVRATQVLRGQLVFQRDGLGNPIAPLAFDDIADVTQKSDVVIDTFQPITVPKDGSTLLFERESSTFVRAIVDANGTGRVLTFFDDPVAVLPGDRIGQLVGRISGLTMTESWHHQRNSEILIIENETDTIMAYNYRAGSVDASLRVFARSDDIRTPVNPDSDRIFVSGGLEQPNLMVAANDVGPNRLLFDLGRDQLLSVNYSSGEPGFTSGNLVVLVARSVDFERVTGRQLTDLTYIERLIPLVTGSGPEHLRAWDVKSSALLSLSVLFRELPVREVNK